MRKRKPALNRERTLKIDKDCFVEEDWIRDYVRMAVRTCRMKQIKVTRIRMSRTRKGFHFYIDTDPPVEAELADRLQWLLGDDCGRVDRNRARIRSCLNGWNKLFEAVGRKLKTIYPHAESRGRSSPISFFEPDPVHREEYVRQTYCEVGTEKEVNSVWRRPRMERRWLLQSESC